MNIKTDNEKRYTVYNSIMRKRKSYRSTDGPGISKNRSLSALTLFSGAPATSRLPGGRGRSVA